VEARRLRTFIQTHEQLAKGVDEKISQEQENIEIATNAISNLEDTIPRVEKALRFQEEILSALQAIVGRFDELSLGTENVPTEEPHSRNLRESINAGITSHATRGAQNTRAQLSSSEIEAANTRSNSPS